ncbi:MAG: proline dehydrogenase family protein [Pseudomonadota bacterium]
MGFDNPDKTVVSEARLQALGEEFLRRAQALEEAQPFASQWLQGLLRQLNRDPGFRVQALRFIDVLPAIANDHDLVHIFHEYFSADEFPLPAAGRFALSTSRLLGDKALAGVIRHATEILAGRFMGGATGDQVLKTLKQLESRGREVSLDRVGELTLSDAEADAYLNAYLDLIAGLGEARSQQLHLSVKLSSLHPQPRAHRMERDADRILERLLPLAEAARSAGASVTLDMEDYDKRPLILHVFERLAFHASLRDWPGLGIAVQSYLREGLADLDYLIELARRRGKPFAVRWVRGAYWDQECVLALQQGWPVPVWQQQGDTDRAYEIGIGRLFNARDAVRPAIATHNPRSIACALAWQEAAAIEPQDTEFQMLYGMAEHYQDALVEAGHRLRVYLPFGEAIPGMAYLVRRMLENASSQSLQRFSGGADADTAGLLAAPVAMEAISPDDTAQGFHNQPVHRFVDDSERAAFAASLEGVRGQLGRDYDLWIGGKGRHSERVIESRDPSHPERVVGRVASAGVADAGDAIDAARLAFPAWRDTTVAERAGLLRTVAHRLRESRDEFAAWEVFEAGKNWTEADADVCEAIDFLEYYAAEAERLGNPRSIEFPGEDNRWFYQPRGVAAIIAPWNFPLAILVGMTSAALVTGNTVIVKPSSDTPVVAAHFVALFRELDIPPGTVNFLPGAGGEVGAFLVGHPHTHLVAFTGSREVGTGIHRGTADVPADQRHLKKVILEMGGKNAIIVDASADPDEAVSGILKSAFGYQGQKCSACSRVIVVGDGYEPFIRRLAQAMDSLRAAPPWEPESDIGPVINARAQARIEEIVSTGSQWGDCYFRAPGGNLDTGFFVAPTLFRDVDPKSPLAQEEIFGPVLATLAAKDFDQALDIANDTAYALTGGLYSRSPANLERAAREFRVGNLYLNRGITGALVGRQPFGGFKLSGVGSKAGGPDYLLQFMEPRCVTENTLRRGFAPLS